MHLEIVLSTITGSLQRNQLNLWRCLTMLEKKLAKKGCERFTEISLLVGVGVRHTHATLVWIRCHHRRSLIHLSRNFGALLLAKNDVSKHSRNGFSITSSKKRKWSWDIFPPLFWQLEKMLQFKYPPTHPPKKKKNTWHLHPSRCWCPLRTVIRPYDPGLL